MLYTPYQYRVCIKALGRSRTKASKWAGPLLLLVTLLLCACFALQENHASIGKPSAPAQLFDEKQVSLAPAAPLETGSQENNGPELARKPIYGNPGARDRWEQDFGSGLEETVLKVSSGDTLYKMLCNAGLAYQEAYQVTEAIRPVFDPAKLRQGQQVCMGFVPGPGGGRMLQVLSLGLDDLQEVQVMRGNDRRFAARVVERSLKTRPVRFSAEIYSSMYQTAIDHGMPISVLMKLMHIYSYDMDFQRDIHAGDRIEVLYEEMITRSGKRVRAGNVLYASLYTGGRNLRVYRHETKGGIEQFFDANGNSVRKALMMTPLDGAVISSGYGMRKHPILGYTKMHRGLDFAAPTGTPVMAAGDGIVSYAGPRGTYGHFVQIRHANDYETVYAHLSGYAKGIKSGLRVRQGETIGYVGSTGRSTGPHLHYEIRRAGQSINPSTLKAPPGQKLDDEEMQRFAATKDRLESLYASLDGNSKTALANQVSGKSKGSAKN